MEMKRVTTQTIASNQQQNEGKAKNDDAKGIKPLGGQLIEHLMFNLKLNNKICPIYGADCQTVEKIQNDFSPLQVTNGGCGG
ncbi:MAG: hypothetical protein H0T62_06710 [Parachlamydiaceae bacterium]|nr:hypothetical protein [Parachlamydiaceae bacterium]